MKKTLLYNMYVDGFVTEHKMYDIHKRCLMYYSHVFDKMIFYVNVNDLNNTVLIDDAINWIMEICGDKPYDIKVRKNTKLCECETFREEILLNRNAHKDTLVFFAHSKNVSRVDENLIPYVTNIPFLVDSVLKWSTTLYFYSLNFIDEMESRLLGCPLPPEIFYGPLMTQLRDPTTSPMLRMNKGNVFYAGCFWWLNVNKLFNYIDNDIIKLPEIDDRYWLEMLPGVIGGREKFGDGCVSHNDVAIFDDFNLYISTPEIWDEIIYILSQGKDEGYWDFHYKMIEGIWGENRNENS